MGAILPFSGALAASGANLELAMRMAADSVSAHGGIGGHKLVLDFRDTHSDTDRGVIAAQEPLHDVGVAHVIGPEEADVALGMVADVKQRHAVQILPA